MKKEFRDALYLLSWPINCNHFLVKPSHGAKRFGLFAELFLFIITRYTKDWKESNAEGISNS